MLVRNHSVSPPASFVEISVVENSLSCNIVRDVNLPISVGMVPSNALPVCFETQTRVMRD